MIMDSFTLKRDGKVIAEKSAKDARELLCEIDAVVARERK